MKVAMYYRNSDIRIEEVPVPKIKPGELLMRVEASGICGSDVLEWYRINKAPLVLGHEVAGVVTEVGENVKKYKPGDRIVAAHHVPCGRCYYCRVGHETCCDTLRRTNFNPGGFAEYLCLPEINVEKGVFLIPDNVSFEEATFTEPLACVLRGQKVINFKKGQTVLVLGSGISGLLHIKLASISGAGKIFATDITPYRIDAAKRFGADHVINALDGDFSELIRSLNNGRLADQVIVCTGAKQALLQALTSVERGGTILFFAPTGKGVNIPISINDLFFRNDITLTTTYAGSPDDYGKALDLIGKGNIDVKGMITHRFNLNDTVKGFEAVARADDSIKVIINPQWR